MDYVQSITEIFLKHNWTLFGALGNGITGRKISIIASSLVSCKTRFLSGRFLSTKKLAGRFLIDFKASRH